jgi:hypothetical protein
MGIMIDEAGNGPLEIAGSNGCSFPYGKSKVLTPPPSFPCRLYPLLLVSMHLLLFLFLFSFLFLMYDT